MRSLFIVVSKVWGLIQAYTGLTYIFMVLPMLRMLGQQSGPADAETTMATTFHGEQITLSVISLLAMVILTFGIAWLLIFRADWLADKLTIPTTDAPSSPSVETLLYAGVKLIGLFITVQSIPLLAQALFQMRHIFPFGAYMWSTITAPVVRIVIGAILMTKTTVLVKFMMGRQGHKAPQPIAASRGSG